MRPGGRAETPRVIRDAPPPPSLPAPLPLDGRVPVGVAPRPLAREGRGREALAWAGPGLRQEEGGRWCPSVVSNQLICEPAVARSITAHELGVVLRTMGGAKIKDSEVPTGAGVVVVGGVW